MVASAFKKLALSLALLGAVMAPGLAMANILPPAIATWRVVYSDTPILRKVIISLPQVHKDSMAFQILNNSPIPLHFVHANGEKTYIPVLSQRTVTVPFATSGQYNLEDGAGNVVQTFGFTDDSVKTAVPGATAEQYASWGKQLQDLIAANQVPAMPEYKQEDKEPAYTPVYHAPSRRVRGYW
jgi:hypothetical protein